MTDESVEAGRLMSMEEDAVAAIIAAGCGYGRGCLCLALANTDGGPFATARNDRRR